MRARVSRGARRHHVVDEKNSLAFDIGSRAQQECARDIAPTAGAGQSRLTRRELLSAQCVKHRRSASSRYGAREKFGLIEPAAPTFPPVKRHRHQKVERLVCFDRAAQIVAEMPRQRFHSRIFEKMNQSAEWALIKAERESPIKTAQTRTAGGAESG